MSNPILPDPIAAYFAADKRSADAVARCFSTQAVVRDEGRTYAGLDDIRAWRAAAAAAYACDLRYRFRLERGLIATLEITT